MKLSVFKICLVLAFLSFAHSSEAQYDKTQFLYSGRGFLAEGRYSSAIENFNVLVRIDPELYEAYFYRGIAKYSLEDFAGALSDFDKALSINPLYTPAYHYRAMAHSRRGEYNLAIADLDRALDLRPGYTGLYFSRGVVYFLSQQFGQAIDDFNVFLRREPDVPEAYLNRGASYLCIGDTIRALDDYDKAISLNRYDPEGYIRRSRIYAQQGKSAAALADLDRSVELDSLNTFALFNRALIRYGEHDIMGALSDLDKVIEIEPGNSLSLYNRALIRSQIGDYGRALDDYDRVVYINPENVLAYFNRAYVFIELSMYENALEDYTTAIGLYPDFAKAYLNRAIVNRELGNYADAEKDYATANRKILEYKSKTGNMDSAGSFADTARAYSHLLSFDADFAQNDFNNELLQDKSVNIMLLPSYRFVPAESERIVMAMDNVYYSADLESFIRSMPFPVDFEACVDNGSGAGASLAGDYESRLDAAVRNKGTGRYYFAKALLESSMNHYNAAESMYGMALGAGTGTENSAFYYINRSVLRSDMISFISSVGSSVQVLSLDNSGSTAAQVKNAMSVDYDYAPAMEDLKKAAEIMPDFPYIYYNMGNLSCMSGNMPDAILEYTKALEIYPYLAEAYYNRGLVQIFLKDNEKGCMDLSRAGELGIQEAYPVIKKYCDSE